MENFSEFSSIEQAAMEQSPAHETDVHHNVIEASCFIDCVVDDVVHVANDATHVVTEATRVVAEDCPAVADATVAAAGGIVIDGVYTKKHIELLNSVNQECSVEELIDLRSSLVKANRM